RPPMPALPRMRRGLKPFGGHTMNRRLVALAAALSLASLAPFSAFAAPKAPTPPAPLTIKILALNDLHGNMESPGTFRANADSPLVPAGGVDYVAGYVAKARAANPHTVV